MSSHPLSNSHLQEVLGLTRAIKAFLSGSESADYQRRDFREGEVLFDEDAPNDTIFIILDGTVELCKVQEPESVITVDTLGPGDLAGLLSFWTGEPALVTGVARTPVSTLCLARAVYDRLSTSHPELNRLLQPLTIWNLAERYQRIVHLHLRVAALTREVEEERNQLREALDRLEQASNYLVHREKMATLGQLVAGVAHEINNPVSALLRSVERMVEELPGVLGGDPDRPEAAPRRALLQLGLSRGTLETEEQRLRMDALGDQHPNLGRPTLRTLSRVGEEGLPLLRVALAECARSGDDRPLTRLLQFFEVGSLLRSMQASVGRIGRLVRSLKSYARQDRGEPELVDIRQGIRETLLIFGNRLKDITLKLDLAEIPQVRCHAGEINQVWTNLILNACDAMQGRGVLAIACGQEGSATVRVAIGDSGPGIPEGLWAKVFEPNFTTKTASGSFGLGLGLAIASEIVQKHGGSITLGTAPEGGALFTVRLPIASIL